MQNFSMRHVLRCPNGGLVITHHNKICDEIIHLTKQYLSPNCVRGKIIIHHGYRRSEKEVCHIRSFPETRGDVSIRDLSESQMKEIIDVRFADDDTYSWNPVIMDKLLSGWEKLNKDKHGQACYYQGRNFLHLYSQWMGRYSKGRRSTSGGNVYLSLAIRYVHV